MPPAALCPDAETIEHFRLGLLPEDEADELLRHLEECAGCLQALADRPDRDQIADVLYRIVTSGTLQGAGDSTAEGSAKQEIEALVERFRRLPAECLTSSGADTSASATLQTQIVHSAEAGERQDRADGTESDLPAGDEGRYDYLAPPQAPDELGRLAGYRILKLLGEGGMGSVFLAEDVQLGRKVALKSMQPERAARPSYRQRFLREARAAASLEHENIVPIYQVGDENGVPFLVMPLLRGRPLSALVEAGQPAPTGLVLRLGRQIAKGLAAAHQQGLIHRDIKPANVWLESRGETDPPRARILDFGLAHAVGNETQLTRSGEILGTPSYMAPEQAAGEPVDFRCDLFSLGCMLYEMSTGRKPFQGRDTMAVLTALALKNPPPPCEANPAIGSALSELVMRLLEKDRTNRPASAAEVADALAEIEQALPTTECRLPAQTAPVLSVADVTPGASVGSAIQSGDNPGRLEAYLTPLPQTAPREPEGVSPRSTSRRIPPRHLWTITASLLAVTALSALAVVIVRDKTGKKVAEFVVPEDGTVETVSDGKPPTRAAKISDDRPMTQPVQPAKVADPGSFSAAEVRRAAEWALSKGAMLEVAGVEGFVSDVSQLPAGEPRVVRVSFRNWASVRDEDFECLIPLRHIEALDLGNPPKLTQAALKQIAENWPRLRALNTAIPVTDAVAAAHLARLKELQELLLSRITRDVIPTLATMETLEWLDVRGAPIVDSDLEILAKLPRLKRLSLQWTSIGDAGVAALKRSLVMRSPSKTLHQLDIEQTKITDEGLRDVADIPGLSTLSIGRTAVSDRGVTHLGRAKGLRYLVVTETKVTAEGVARLKLALPQCSIQSDFSKERIGELVKQLSENPD